jgi:hypothetical protein
MSEVNSSWIVMSAIIPAFGALPKSAIYARGQYSIAQRIRRKIYGMLASVLQDGCCVKTAQLSFRVTAEHAQSAEESLEISKDLTGLADLSGLFWVISGLLVLPFERLVIELLR